jgi:Cyclic nucleotide-binding domain/Tetratricopeptide repeat
MVLGFGQTKGASPARPDDVSALIAKKNYAKAIEVIKKQLQTQRHDSRLRLQLGDLLVLAGKTKEAVAILTPLADEFAREGFAAKSIAVLKKIQKIDPGQRDVEAKLANLIQDKQRVATVAPPPAAMMPEFGMEEIGFEPEPVSARRADPEPSPAFGIEAEPEGGPEAAPQVERQPEPEPPPPVRAAPAPAVAERAAPPAPLPPPVEDRDLIDETAEDELPLEGLPDLTLDADAELPLAPETGKTAEPELELQADPEPEPEIEPEPPAEPMTESRFAEELMSLVEGAFNDPSAAMAPAPDAAGSGGNQIVVSPLFKDFSVDELVAVIHGLNLITFESGDIILTEGDPGDSMYMLTAGTVKAVKRNAAGRQVAVNELSEGAFFGEISILTGKPRSATVVATSHCELLELDRPTLDSIVATHPNVRQVLEKFSKERLANQPRR